MSSTDDDGRLGADLDDRGIRTGDGPALLGDDLDDRGQPHPRSTEDGPDEEVEETRPR